MKGSLIFLFALLVLPFQGESQNPLPIPIPGINLQTIQGLWYVTFLYEYTMNNSNQNPITCFTYDFNVTGNSIQANHSIYYNQVPDVAIFNYDIGNSTSIWIDQSDGSVLDWLAIDPVAFSWGVLGSATSQYAEIISRSPQLSNNLIAVLLTMLGSENYLIDSDNTLFITNTCNL